MDRRRYGLIVVALLLGVALSTGAAQLGPVYVDSGTPAGACSGSRVRSSATSGLLYCCVGGSWTACGSGIVPPGGSNTQVQFNDGGAFGGDAGLTYDKTTDTLTTAGAYSGATRGVTLKKVTVLPAGYIETTPIAFRFDQDVLRFVNRGRYSGASISAPAFTSSELDYLFSQYSVFVNLNGKADGASITVTGLPNLGASANTQVYPFIMLHSSSTGARVVMEVEKTGNPGVWEQLADWTFATPYFHLAEVTSGSGYLTGARFTFYNTTSPGNPFASNIYVRWVGVWARHEDAFQWTVKRGGDTIFGKLRAQVSGSNSTALEVEQGDYLDLGDGASDHLYSTGTTIATPGSLTASGGFIGNASTASALSADPSDCASANEWAKGIVASGAATCAQVGFSNLSGTAGVTQGGTGQTSWGDNEMLVGTGVNTVARISLPAVACTASTAKILWDPAGNGTWSCGVDLGSPAGATNVLQTNNGSGGMGAYGGTSCSASNWVSALSNTGSATCTQPGFSNLSGSATAAQLPDATGAAKGAVVLAGALGGTADSPTVVDNSHNHNSTTVSALDASTDITTGSLPVARGGTAQTTWAADQVLVGTGSGTVARKGIPDCRTLSDKLQYDATNHIFSCAQDQTSESTPTDWTNASLLTGFTNIGSPFASTRYKKTPDGIVFIEVAVNRSANTQIFQLPSGYRPGTRLDLLGFYGYTAFTVGSFYITTDGYVTWNGTSGSGMRLNASFIATIPLTVTSTSSVYGYCFNASGGCQATTDTATCSASGGTGPYTYAWSYISGNTATVNSPSSASTTFTRTASGVVRTGVYRCTATDTVSGRTGTADTTVVTEHENLL